MFRGVEQYLIGIIFFVITLNILLSQRDANIDINKI